MPKTRREPIRIVVVDDSPTARKLLVALFNDIDDIEVVGTADDGEMGVHITRELCPDVVTMDVRMPKMDGLEATRHIMHYQPTPIVIVTNSTMRADMDLTFEALHAGALTVVRKPGLVDPETSAKVLKAVRLMADVPVVHRWRREKRKPDGERLSGSKRDRLPVQVEEGVALPSAAWQLDVDVAQRVQRIGIAASTGGPRALLTVLRSLPADFRVPILIVQHITNGFVSGLAEWLNSMTALHVNIAGHGDIPRPGTALVAPDDYHMQLSNSGVVELCREPPYKGLRPSANYLFHSLADAYGSRSMGIVLTGMGDDGADGLVALRKAGGLTIAQDKQSSVIYGMPHEAVTRNAVDRMLAPGQIAQTLAQLMHHQRSRGDG
ncbi:MAG: chemotaxis-specific protein-glutamate methyltransferase CheB [Chloroflexi bacterium]|nr:chemotaxis-specific protein-glutamate methyltransferase CheB [Chloroflexota bacterium]